MLLGKRPRVRLCALPTPLEELPRLSEALGGPRILIKRDDLTGLGVGGNKGRPLEFLLGDALAKGADVLITAGPSQSNHCRITAAAACKAGLRACVVLRPDEHPEMQGNLLLDKLFGADVRWVESGGPEAQDEMMEVAARQYEAEGLKPYVIPRGGANRVGSVGYVYCVDEMVQQFNALGVVPNWIFTAAGSTGTQAGLMVGARWMLSRGCKVAGICMAQNSEKLAPGLLKHANAVAEEMGAEFRFEQEDVLLYDDYIGGGLGKVTQGGLEAIQLFARTEGIVLEPVYSGKAAAGMIDLIRKGVVTRDDTVIVLHTGGIPAFFTWNRELTEGLSL